MADAKFFTKIRKNGILPRCRELAIGRLDAPARAARSPLGLLGTRRRMRGGFFMNGRLNPLELHETRVKWGVFSAAERR
jgi:hypothetical protein